MKKAVLGLVAAAFVVSCIPYQPVEKLLPPTDVETIGTGYNLFAPDSDVRIVMAQTPSKKWTVRATVPLRRVADEKVESLTTTLDLMDATGVRLNTAFDLIGQDIYSLVPVLNDDAKPARSVVYMATAEMDYKTLKPIVENTAFGRLHLEATMAAPAEEEVAEKAKKEKAPFPDDPSVQDLVSYYGIRGILRQYESAYRKGNKTLCKQIQNRLEKIEDAVSDHPKGGRKISNALEDWIDDRIDDIEDKVDDEKDAKKKRR